MNRTHDRMTLKNTSMLLAMLIFFSAQIIDTACRASPASLQLKDLQSQKDETRKIIGKNWKSLKPCIKLFIKNHEDAAFFVLRFQIEPENKIGTVKTKPADEEVSACLKSALWTMAFPPVSEEISIYYKIDLTADAGDEGKEKEEEKQPDLPPGSQKENQEVKEADVPQQPETAGKPDDTKPAPLLRIPPESKHLYIIGGKPVAAYKLRSFLIDQPSSAHLAKKSRAHSAGGWFMRVTGLLMGISGAFLLGFGVNEYLIDDHPASWAAAFTATGASMLAVGITFEIVGRIVIAKNWPYLIHAIDAYNATGPDEPIQQVLIVHKSQ